MPQSVGLSRTDRPFLGMAKRSRPSRASASTPRVSEGLISLQASVTELI